jgi:uncharacterized protein (TIGR00369 family)
MSPSQITEADFRRILLEGLPSGAGMSYRFLELSRGRVVVHFTPTAADTRPGGTVAGPVLFGLADLAMFAAVLSVVGYQPMAVTSDATIHFLRRPRAVPLVAKGRLLKEGRRLAVGEVTIEHEEEPDVVVTHAVMTYAIPPG